MSLVRDEQTKLLANALNTAATSCFTVGIATPLAGWLYNVSGIRSTVSASGLVFGVLVRLVAAVCLHTSARRSLRGLEP